jgi:hypothetical protein
MENGALPGHGLLEVLERKSWVRDRVVYNPSAQVDLFSARRTFESLEGPLFVIQGHTRAAVRAIDVRRQQLCKKSRHLVFTFLRRGGPPLLNTVTACASLNTAKSSRNRPLSPEACRSMYLCM